jgi:uncharacterized membrane protein SirB2
MLKKLARRGRARIDPAQSMSEGRPARRGSGRYSAALAGNARQQERHGVEEFYLQIRAVHIGSVMASGLLFFIRTAGRNLFDASWPMALPLRILVYAVDTILLTAALMLMTIIQQFPFVDGWLTVKVVLLIAYIAIGWWAFRAERKNVRIACSVAALAIFGFIITVARTHNPLGFLSTI